MPVLVVGDRLKMDDSTENDGLGDKHVCLLLPPLPHSSSYLSLSFSFQPFPSTTTILGDVQLPYEHPPGTGEGNVLDTSNSGKPEAPPDTNADAPTIPSIATIAEKFADEFWTSATTTESAIASPSTTPHVESPTDSFEFVASPSCREGHCSKSNRDLIEHHEETRDACSNAEGEVETCAPDVAQIPGEDDANKHIDKAPPLVPSSASYPPTPESLALATHPTPAQEEVDMAWLAPSNDNMNAADTWDLEQLPHLIQILMTRGD